MRRGPSPDINLYTPHVHLYVTSHTGVLWPYEGGRVVRSSLGTTNRRGRKGVGPQKVTGDGVEDSVLYTCLLSVGKYTENCWDLLLPRRWHWGDTWKFHWPFQETYTGRRRRDWYFRDLSEELWRGLRPYKVTGGVVWVWTNPKCFLYRL